MPGAVSNGTMLSNQHCYLRQYLYFRSIFVPAKQVKLSTDGLESGVVSHLASSLLSCACDSLATGWAV